MSIGTMTSKGQITVPKDVRDALGLSAGTQVEFIDTGDGRYAIAPVRKKRVRAADLIGFITYDGPTVTIEAMDDAIAQAAAGT